MNPELPGMPSEKAEQATYLDTRCLYPASKRKRREESEAAGAASSGRNGEADLELERPHEMPQNVLCHWAGSLNGLA